MKVAFFPNMMNSTPLLAKGPRRKRAREFRRIFWESGLTEVHEPREVLPPARPERVPTVLAPAPWPQGEFRPDPES
jgi:hypothetical protein